MTFPLPPPEDWPPLPQVVNRVQWEAHLTAHLLVTTELQGLRAQGASVLLTDQNPRALAAALLSELTATVRLLALATGEDPEALWSAFTAHWQARHPEPQPPPPQPPE